MENPIDIADAGDGQFSYDVYKFEPAYPYEIETTFKITL
jgi:hypothetical protein